MSAGHHLKRPYEIHERNDFVGGHAITIEEKGYRFDRTGHLLHLRDEAMRRWVTTLLKDRTVTVERKSRVFSHGVYTRYPYQANTFGLPPDIAYECLTGFLEALQKQAQTTEPNTFEEFCLKYFGEGFSKHFMIPYNAKLWGTHPREITAQWCSRFVPMPKLDDVIAGAVGKNDRELGYNTNFLYPKQGIGELPKALYKGLEQHTLLEHAPTSIDFQNKRIHFQDGSRDYQALIATLPLDILLALLQDLPADIQEAASKLRCNPLWYLDVALQRPCGVDLHWAYVPEERFPFYRVGCYSNFSEQMAPPGKAGLYVELSSREKPDMAILLPKVIEGLIEMRIIDKADDVAFASPRLISHAYVLYDHNYYGALDRIKPFLARHNIIPTGRYGDWNYSSMEDALLFGQKAAQQAEELCT
ncbi:MAG: FAD-dependent oxidoreductase [Myxococcales bacterium]|nr:MAG: FAD-dependent oxidoreductase [Myxococcales bacterium]